MTHYCPRCGHNIEADPAIALGDWSICIEQGVSWRGIEIALTPRQLSFMHSLAAYPGRLLDPYVLLARAGSATAESDPQSAAIAASNTRRQIVERLRAVHVPVPIEQKRGMGIRWIGSPDKDIRSGSAA